MRRKGGAATVNRVRRKVRRGQRRHRLREMACRRMTAATPAVSHQTWKGSRWKLPPAGEKTTCGQQKWPCSQGDLPAWTRGLHATSVQPVLCLLSWLCPPVWCWPPGPDTHKPFPCALLPSPVLGIGRQELLYCVHSWWGAGCGLHLQPPTFLHRPPHSVMHIHSPPTLIPPSRAYMWALLNCVLASASRIFWK